MSQDWQGRSIRRCGESVSYLRDFCHAVELVGMPLHDPMSDIGHPNLL
jgi:hypothetical protein